MRRARRPFRTNNLAWTLGLALLVSVSGVAQAQILNPDNGNYYDAIATPGGVTWDAANIAAQAIDFNGCQGHLATITSQIENDFIVTNFPQAPTPDAMGRVYWFGGFQPPGSPEPAGGWEWVTGEAFSYTNWRPGEPNDLGGVEDFLQFHGSTIGTWNDNDGSLGMSGYVVEFEGPCMPDAPSMPAVGAVVLLVMLLLFGAWHVWRG